MSRSFGRYRVVRPLGEGATAEVFEVEDGALGVRRALKVLHPDVAQNDELRARFEAEARTLAQLRHPHLVAVHDVGEADGRPWLVMDLAERGSLADRVAREGPMAPENVLRELFGVLDALAIVHAAGIIHRDIKPQNLLYDAAGHLRLADFGIALTGGVELTRTGMVLGSWGFMAPEQRLDPRKVRPATDLFGVAASALWAIVGGPVSDLHVSEHRAALLRDVSDDVSGVLHRALAFRPEERFRSAGEMKAAVEGVVGEEARPPSRSPTEGELLGRGRPLAEAGSAPPLGGRARPTLAAHGPDGPNRGGVVPVTPLPAGPSLPAATGWARMGGLVLASVALAGGVGATAARWASAPAREVTATEAPTMETAPTGALPACAEGVGALLPVVRPGPEETLAAAVFDLDGDGINEAVYTNQQAERLSVWWGQQGSLLVERADVPSGRSAAPALLLEEGAARVLLLPRADTGDIARWSVSGRTLTPMAPISQPGSPRGAVLAHWDADAPLDLVVNTEPCLMVRPGDGAGGFGSGSCVAMQPYGAALGAVTVGGRRLAVLEEGRALALVEGGADGAPDMRERLPFWGALVRRARAEIYAHLPEQSGLARWTRREDAPLGTADAWSACLWATGQIDGRALHTVEDLDGDEIPELIGSRTCAGCTSNQVGWRR